MRGFGGVEESKIVPSVDGVVLEVTRGVAAAAARRRERDAVVRRGICIMYAIWGVEGMVSLVYWSWPVLRQAWIGVVRDTGGLWIMWGL